MNKLAELRRIAEAGTKGEWRFDECAGVYCETHKVARVYMDKIVTPNGLPNALHIATFSPATVLRLLDAYHALERGLEDIVQQGDDRESNLAETALAHAQRILEG